MVFERQLTLFSQDDLALTIKTTDNIPVGITFEATKDFDSGYPYFKSFSARFDTVKAIAITFQSPVEEIFNVTLGTDGTVKVCGNEVTGQKIQNDDFILSVYQAPDFFDTQNVMLTADTFTVPIKELLNCVPTGELDFGMSFEEVQKIGFSLQEEGTALLKSFAYAYNVQPNVDQCFNPDGTGHCDLYDNTICHDTLDLINPACFAKTRAWLC